MRTITLLWAAGLVLLARGAAAQDVNYDYDRHADFAAYRTYAWVGGTALAADGLNHARIVAAVDSQLAMKGLAQEDSAAIPDLQVFYQVGLRQDLEFDGYDNYGPPPGGPSRGRAKPVLVGALVVSMIEAKSHSMVWRAAAAKDLDLGQSPEQWERSVNKAVEKMFKHYPESGQVVR